MSKVFSFDVIFVDVLDDTRSVVRVGWINVDVVANVNVDDGAVFLMSFVTFASSDSFLDTLMFDVFVVYGMSSASCNIVGGVYFYFVDDYIITILYSIFYIIIAVITVVYIIIVVYITCDDTGFFVATIVDILVDIFVAAFVDVTVPIIYCSVKVLVPHAVESGGFASVGITELLDQGGNWEGISVNAIVELIEDRSEYNYIFVSFLCLTHGAKMIRTEQYLLR